MFPHSNLHIYVEGICLTHRLGCRVIEERLEVVVVSSESAARKKQPLSFLLHLRVIS